MNSVIHFVWGLNVAAVGSYLLLVGAAAIVLGVKLLVSGLEDRPVVTAWIAIPIGLFMLWLFWRIITAKKRAPAPADAS